MERVFGLIRLNLADYLESKVVTNSLLLFLPNQAHEGCEWCLVH